MPDLIFCRTPLQSLIAQEISHIQNCVVTLIYHPTSDGNKHRYYFDNFKAYKKIWIPYRSQCSDTLSDALAWWRIPTEVRNTTYDSLFIASVGSIPFSIFARKNAQANIYTYDDGLFNLSSEKFWRWINHEPLARRLVKYALRGISNSNLIQKSKVHFTIFPKKYVMRGSDVREIFLAHTPNMSKSSIPEPNVRVLLGSWFEDSAQRAIYIGIVKSRNYDLFIPHPGTAEDPYIIERLKDVISDDQLRLLIAEDLVLLLVNEGLMPEVYGFDSTALFNLSRYVSVKNIEIRKDNRLVPVGVMEALGIQCCSPNDTLENYR